MDENKTLVLRKDAARAINGDYIWMTLPLMAMGIYLYGMRTALLCLTAVVTANVCDRIVALLRNHAYEKKDISSETIGLILVLLFPVTVKYYVVVIAVSVAVLLGKEAFGGYGAYPFNPMALGFAVAGVSWPEQVFGYPAPFTKIPLWDASAVATAQGAAYTLRIGGTPNISLFNLVLGNYAGPIGITSTLIIIACAMYLWMRKRITFAAPVSFMVVCTLIAFLFPRMGGIGLALPWQYLNLRVASVVYEILSGALIYAAIFLINEPVTAPRSELSRLVCGALLGVLTMLFRYFGTYDLSVCFSILAMNSVTGYFDRILAPKAKRIKEVQDNG